jgi:peptidoglycan/LPS O-acetylase OafA/YrhL
MLPRLSLAYRSSQHVRAFDAFRGYGMTGVFLYHCLVYPPLKQWMNWIWFGVDFFFVISGFLITGILLETRQKPNCLRDFYVRRVLRIFPVYYGTLAAATLLLWYAGTPRTERMLASMPWFWAYLQNYKIGIQGWSSMLPLSHTWSLAIEEQFYLLWPLLVVFLNNRRLLVLCAVASVFSFTLRQFYVEWPFAYMFTPTRLEGVMLGSALAILIRSHREVLERLVPFTLPFSALGLASVAWTQHGFHLQNEWVIRVGYPLMALFFGSVILCALDTGRVGRITRWFSEREAMAFVGRYSYGIYLFHWPLHCELKRPIFAWLEARLDTSFAVCMGYLVIMSALTLGLSVASFHLFEKRFLRLKDVFAPRAV